jgi:ribosome-binding ATPase YchF (GTP1/OBG family)
MNQHKVYVLAKDGHDAPKGQKYYRNEWTARYQPKDSEGHVIPHLADYSERFVENNTTWFKPLEDDEISKAKELLESKGYSVSSDAGVRTVHDIIKRAQALKLQYTEDDMRKAFESGREVHPKLQRVFRGCKYYNFDEYLKSLK